VADVPGTPGSTVYIGSYDHHLYAIDALNGKLRWRYDVGGAIPGTAVVIGAYRLHLELCDPEVDRDRRVDPQEGVQLRLARVHADGLRWAKPLPGRLLLDGPLRRKEVKGRERGSQDSNLESPVLETGALANLATAPSVRIVTAN
jgi:hypothetical protein